MDIQDITLLTNLTIGGSIGYSVFLIPFMKSDYSLFLGYVFGTVMGYTWFVINSECKCN